MNTSLNFTTSDIQALNNNVNNTKDEINTTIGNIKSCFAELENNITGTQVNTTIKKISTSIDNVNSKMTTAFADLTAFLDKQMKNYTTTYANANTNLKGALDFINQNF